MSSAAGTTILDDQGKTVLDENGKELLSDGTSDCDCCPPPPPTDVCWYNWTATYNCCDGTWSVTSGPEPAFCSDTAPGPTVWTQTNGDICDDPGESSPTFTIWQSESSQSCDPAAPSCPGGTQPDAPIPLPKCIGTTSATLNVDVSHLLFSSGAAGGAYDSPATFSSYTGTGGCGNRGYDVPLAQTFQMVQNDLCDKFHNSFVSKTTTYTLGDGSTTTDLAVYPYQNVLTPDTTVHYHDPGSTTCYNVTLGTGSGCSSAIQVDTAIQQLFWVPGDGTNPGFWRMTWKGCYFNGGNDCTTIPGRFYPDSGCYGYGGSGCPTDDHFSGYIEVFY